MIWPSRSLKVAFSEQSSDFFLWMFIKYSVRERKCHLRNPPEHSKFKTTVAWLFRKSGNLSTVVYLAESRRINADIKQEEKTAEFSCSLFQEFLFSCVLTTH